MCAQNYARLVVVNDESFNASYIDQKKKTTKSRRSYTSRSCQVYLRAK